MRCARLRLSNLNIGAGRMGRTLVLRAALMLASALLAGTFAVGPAAADYASDYKACFSFDTKAPDRIATCTRAINAGRMRGRDLAGAYNWRAEGYRIAKQYDNALADFARSIQADPQLVYPYTNRAEVYRVLGNYDAVIADATEAIRIDPALNASYTIRGLAYEKKGDVAKARADFNKTLAMPVKGNDGAWAQDLARNRLKEMDGN